VIDAHTSDFTIKKGGKVVVSVHRVVSADGKTLTVHNKGTHADGKAYDCDAIQRTQIAGARGIPPE